MDMNTAKEIASVQPLVALRNSGLRFPMASRAYPLLNPLRPLIIWSEP